jgi:Flp pilus assembly pilin Flp
VDAIAASRPVRNRRGQALSEYAILVALVGMGLVAILGLFSRATRNVLQQNSNQLSEVHGTAFGGGGGASSGAGWSGSARTPPSKLPSDAADSAASASVPATDAPAPGSVLAAQQGRP